MNKMETIKVITFLAGNYDSISKKDATQKQIMVNTWHSCLSDLDYDLVMNAIQKTIIESPYPPTIHEVRKNAVELINPSSNRTAIEAWNDAIKMIGSGLYMTQEQFEMAPNDIKKFFGSVNQVKQLAMVDMDTINTVVKGQFLKQYEILQERENKNKLLPNRLKGMIEDLSQKMAIGGAIDENL